jgi:hypothetical protein
VACLNPGQFTEKVPEPAYGRGSRGKGTWVPDTGEQLRGSERAVLSRYLVERYAAGESLMRLAQDTGRSFGHVRRLLMDAGVTMRPRGGSRPRTT